MYLFQGDPNQNITGPKDKQKYYKEKKREDSRFVVVVECIMCMYLCVHPCVRACVRVWVFCLFVLVDLWSSFTTDLRKSRKDVRERCHTVF